MGNHPNSDFRSTFRFVSDPTSLLQAANWQWGKRRCRWLDPGPGPPMRSAVCHPPSNHRALLLQTPLVLQELQANCSICGETQTANWSLVKGRLVATSQTSCPQPPCPGLYVDVDILSHVLSSQNPAPCGLSLWWFRIGRTEQRTEHGPEFRFCLEAMPMGVEADSVD